MMAIKLNLRENERRAAYQNLVVDQMNAGVTVQNVGIAPARGQRRSSSAWRTWSVIWLGAIAVLDGKFSVGMLYAFIGFKLVFLGRVNTLVEKWNEFRMLDLHAERIADIALAEPRSRRAFRVPRAERPRAHHASKRKRAQLRLRARRVRVPGRGLLGRARRDRGDRRAVRVRQDHAHQGAGWGCSHRTEGAVTA